MYICVCVALVQLQAYHVYKTATRYKQTVETNTLSEASNSSIYNEAIQVEAASSKCQDGYASRGIGVSIRPVMDKADRETSSARLEICDPSCSKLCDHVREICVRLHEQIAWARYSVIVSCSQEANGWSWAKASCPVQKPSAQPQLHCIRLQGRTGTGVTSAISSECFPFSDIQQISIMAYRISQKNDRFSWNHVRIAFLNDFHDLSLEHMWVICEPCIAMWGCWRKHGLPEHGAHQPWQQWRWCLGDLGGWHLDLDHGDGNVMKAPRDFDDVWRGSHWDLLTNSYTFINWQSLMCFTLIYLSLTYFSNSKFEFKLSIQNI